MTEIDEWATIGHTPATAPDGGVYVAVNRNDGREVGRLDYFYLDDQTIQFGEVKVDPNFTRRRVATALLRQLNADNPNHRINPGARNEVGQAFMDHILNTEGDKVASNGVLSVPLSTMLPPGFRPTDVQRRLDGSGA